MNRVQFFPSEELMNRLTDEAEKKGVTVSQLVGDILERHFELAKPGRSITELTVDVLKEVEEYIQKDDVNRFDLLAASETYRNIEMFSGGRPSTVRASIGRSFAGRIGTGPFKNIRKCIVNGKQKLSANNALVYEKF